jgi:peroxiredoxin (alkyl hydroperoxide reductase subunit C)
MVLVGKMAPSFRAKAVIQGKIVDDFSLSHYLGQYVVFFFYPLDFTYVCPTEIMSFQEAQGALEKRGAQVVGCSVDSAHAHLAWCSLPPHLGGIEGVSFPLVSDLTKSIASAYHVLKEDEGIAYRGLFILDKEGVIRHQLVNDLPLGRSIDEVLRLLDALIFCETSGDVCPANWKSGAKTLTPTREGVQAYFSVR